MGFMISPIFSEKCTPLPALKNEAHQKLERQWGGGGGGQGGALKREAPFHEIIPRKSTINNLKSS